jgi:hypothetical protein
MRQANIQVSRRFYLALSRVREPRPVAPKHPAKERVPLAVEGVYRPTRASPSLLLSLRKQ